MARVLLGVTGSVAALKTPSLVDALLQAGHDVRVVATQASLYFFDPAELTTRAVPLFRDEDEWPGERYQRDHPVLHIELRRWADLLLLAPLDANTLAKLAVGLSDNCLTCVVRAWEPTRPILLAPAMNTLMWQHPLTRRHLQALCEEEGLPCELDDLIAALNARPGPYRIVPPISKRLACGDVGVGAMAELDVIVAAVQQSLQEHSTSRGVASPATEASHAQ
jgi:phosphopantothenoylcysteine decarboxylase